VQLRQRGGGMVRDGWSMLQYQRPHTELTLAEGLREYYASRAGLVSGRGISHEAREFFRCHDAAHVVFGCSTALLDEAAVKVWSFLGTTGGLDVFRGYRLPESKEIYEHITWRDTATTAVRATAALPLVVWRCLRMRKRWPWADFDHHLRTPLREIRSEYGIQPVQR
jgi:hypothetical protein